MPRRQPKLKYDNRLSGKNYGRYTSLSIDNNEYNDRKSGISFSKSLANNSPYIH